MHSIVPKVRFRVNERLLRPLWRCRDAGVRTSYLMIIHLLNGRSASNLRKGWASAEGEGCLLAYSGGSQCHCPKCGEFHEF
jgi:hypothetical protein